MEKNSKGAYTVFLKCTGVKIVSKLALFFKKIVRQKELVEYTDDDGDDTKKMFIWFDRMNRNPRQISQNYFATQGNEWASKSKWYVIFFYDSGKQ